MNKLIAGGLAVALIGTGYTFVNQGQEAIAQDEVESQSSIQCDRLALTKVITPDGVSTHSESEVGRIKVQQALLHWCKKAQSEGHLEGAYMTERDFIAKDNFAEVMSSRNNYWAIRSVVLADGREVSFNEAQAALLRGTDGDGFKSGYRFPTMMANGVIYVAPDFIAQLSEQ